MKRIGNPKWMLFLQKASDAEVAELFRAFLEYPDRQCNSIFWPYIKSELEEDEKRYKAKCERLAANRSRYHDDINMTSADISMKSGAMANNNSQFNNNINNKNKVNALINDFSKNFNPNSEPKYEIFHDFSFAEIIRRDQNLGQILAMYPEQVLIKAQQALVRKCTGSKLSMKAIMVWIEEQNKHYRAENK